MRIVRPWAEVLGDLRWAMDWGRGLILFYSVIATAVYALSMLSSKPALSIPLVTVLILYVTLGTLAGCVVGLLRPLAIRSAWGAAVVGTLAACPVYSGVILAVIRNKALIPEPVAGIASVFLLAPVVGGGVGYQWFNKFKRRL